MKKYMYIIDYNTPGIYKIELDYNQIKQTPDEILTDYGLNEDECYWMFTDKDLKLEKINKI